MPIIHSSLEKKNNLILTLRLISGLIWGGTALRRIFTPGFSNFESRITQMAQGGTFYPEPIINWAVTNWFLIFVIVLFFEIVSSLSLLTGTFSRIGAFIATVNGFAIGLAGIGLSIFDLIIPWSAAVITAILFLFSHPGMYYGLDEKLSQKNLPIVLKVFI